MKPMPGLVLARLDAERPMSRPVDRDPAAVKRPQARDHLAKLRCPLPSTPGDAQHFACPQIAAETVERANTAIVRWRRAIGLEDDRLRPAASLRPRSCLDLDHHVAADHAAREFLRIRVLRHRLRRYLAVAHHGDPVGDLHYLLELVGDEEDSVAGFAQCLADAHEERSDFARGQHACRLVEDEDFGLAVERLQDLDALAHAHGQSPDLAPRDRHRSRSCALSSRMRLSCAA